MQHVLTAHSVKERSVKQDEQLLNSWNKLIIILFLLIVYIFMSLAAEESSCLTALVCLVPRHHVVIFIHGL